MRVGLCCKQEAVKNLSSQQIGLCFSIVSQNQNVLYPSLPHGLLKCIPRPQKLLQHDSNQRENVQNPKRSKEHKNQKSEEQQPQSILTD